MQDLIISNVKADLPGRIVVRVQIVEIEPTDATEVEDAAMYYNELRKELEHSYDRLDVPQRKRRRAILCLRDSSVELACPLTPEVVYDLLSDETLEDKNVGDALGIDEGQ